MLLRLALSGEPATVCTELSLDWQAIYRLAEKQSVLGICFAGIERINGNLNDNIPMELLLQWMGQAERIKSQNELVSRAAAETVHHFRSMGLNGVILKGQGIAQLYDHNLGMLRTPGDIDFWVTNASPEQLIALAKAHHNGEGAKYHHIDYGTIGGVAVELHYRASWFYCPWLNRRFQRFSSAQRENGGLNNTPSYKGDVPTDLPTPSLAFNDVYLLVHIYRHLFSEGIGLRQLVDYYFLLKASAAGPAWAERRQATMQVLRELGMARFAAAAMWIMQEALGAPEDWLLCAPSEADGSFLLSEVMQAGNFGHSDSRLRRRADEPLLRFALRKIHRNFRLFRFGPWEVLFTPLWRAWHYFWWMPRHNSRRAD